MIRAIVAPAQAGAAAFDAGTLHHHETAPAYARVTGIFV